jgi:hypothetical protein
MAERIDCAHCNKAGTCSNGLNGDACIVCSGKYVRRKGNAGASLKGVVCSVCKGRGTDEPFSLKLQNRFLPFFAVGFLFLLLGFVIAAYFWSTGYKDVVAFAGPVIGSIVAFYFGAKNK